MEGDNFHAVLNAEMLRFESELKFSMCHCLLVNNRLCFVNSCTSPGHISLKKKSKFYVFKKFCFFFFYTCSAYKDNHLSQKLQDFQSAESVRELMSEVITLQASRGQDLF